MSQICKQSGRSFEVSARDKAFLEKLAPGIGGEILPIPEPNLCPRERQRRRMAFRNERKLYRRKCDKTGKEIISMYRPDAPFPVYSSKEWFGDGWSGKDYGLDFDFSRPFFEQFVELRNKVPHLSLISSNNENSDFCNIVGKSKDCYLIYGSINCRDCYYGSPFNCTDCADSLLLRNSQLCIECMDSDNLYNCYFCQNCTNSQDLQFCFGVDNSHHCFACVDLNRKEYCVLNKQYSKEEYEKLVGNINLGDPQVFASIMEKFETLKKSVPHRAYIGTNNENVSGNYIFNCQNAFDSYNVEKCQDITYCTQLLGAKDVMDGDYGEYGEMAYEYMGFFNNCHQLLFSYFCWDGVNNLIYCGQCNQGVKDCFGSIGLKRSQYCILNKQYSKEDYEALVPKIVEYMRTTGEWGEFFPINASPFAYNETVAQEFHPLTKEEAEKNGWSWFDDAESKKYEGHRVEIPQNIDEAGQDICEKTLTCEVSGRAYKIIPREFKLYKRMHKPLPRKSPDQRHIERLSRRNPRELWQRRCGKCGSEIMTTYSPERPEQVYCEKCYAQAVY